MYLTTSWDDGHPLDCKLADMLARHNIAGTFYCPGSNAEELPVLSAAGLRALDSQFEIGSHTLDHAYANRMSPEEWKAQVVRGKTQIEDMLGHAVQGFCYPGGNFTAAARATVVEAGFSYARTTENFRLECGSDPFVIPTSLQFFPHKRSVLLRNFIRRGHWAQRLDLTTTCLLTGNFEQRLRHALNACRDSKGMFHVWGHSWEIDRHGLWPHLDRFLAFVASCVPEAHRFTNSGLLRANGILK